MILEYKQIPIYYTDQGQGQPVVLLHGFLETSKMWQNLAAEIEPNHRIITIDLLGHGQTGSLGYIHTMEQMAEAVVHVLDYLKIGKTYVIGHSMGGYVALALAETNMERIKGLCLVNSTPFSDSPERQINRDRAIKVVKQSPLSFVSMSIGNLLSPDNRLQFADEIEFIKLEAMKLSVQGIVAAMEGMKIRKDRSELLKQMPGAKLAILGKEDPVLEYDSLNTQLMDLGVKTVTFSGGHMSFIENKSELTYIIKHFIEK